MQKYWVFEATYKDGSERVCIANSNLCRILDASDLVPISLVNKNNADQFHKSHTVTSGTVPPWLEKPLPRQWPMWVENTGTGNRFRAQATEESVTVLPPVGLRDRTTDEFLAGPMGADSFHVNYLILGSPDLPEWLKTEAQQ